MVCHVVNKEQNTGISTARNSVEREREQCRRIEWVNCKITIQPFLLHWTIGLDHLVMANICHQKH